MKRINRITAIGRSRPTVALIFGGRGCEHDVSVASAEFLITKIDRRKYRVLPVLIARDGRWLVPEGAGRITPKGMDDASHQGGGSGSRKNATLSCVTIGMSDGFGGLITEDGFTPIDCAIPLLHGDLGEDGTVQGVLRSFSIPFVGCDGISGAVASDKIYTKMIAESLGIRTARFTYGNGLSELADARKRAEEAFGYPMFIKPARLGSSIGASPVLSNEEFSKAYTAAAELDGRVLIEEKIDVEAELECAYISVKCKQLFTEIGEIREESGFYDYSEKYGSSSSARIILPSGKDTAHGDFIRETAARLVSALGLSQLSRIDFFLSRDGVIYFNEINTLPGFTEASLYPRLAERAGFPIRRLIDLFIREATERV